MRIKAVVLDFDGTLYNTFPNGLRSTKDVFRHIGRPFRKQDELTIRELWGDSLRRIIAALFPEQPPSIHRKLMRLWTQYAREREIRTPSRLIPGTNPALKALKRMGLTVAIATNRAAMFFYEALYTSKLAIAHIDYCLAHNPSRAFAEFLAQRKDRPLIEGTPYKKPDPRYLVKLQRFLRRKGIAPHEVIFCGDTLTDAETSRTGGYNFIPVLTSPAGTTNAWWEARLAEMKFPPPAIASSVRDLPLLIQTLEQQIDTQLGAD